jgi:hypothetical protein
VTDSLAALRGAARLLLAMLAAMLLGSCGSGAVSSTNATSNVPVTVSPNSATLYSDLPATFVVSGGNGNYIVTSSDQMVLPVQSAPLTATNAFTVVPSAVGTDTQVTLTVRDTGTAPTATAQLTIKPRTVSNIVTVTPSSSQSAACGASICAGGDAEVKVLLTQAGVPLAGRQVRFDVLSGDFRIITSAPGLPEALSISGTAVTDSSGTARIRVRVLSDAGAQTALLLITDLSTGSSTTTALSIAPSSNAPLSAQPSTISFIGRDNDTCASGVSADVIVFGGRPPYLVTSPGTFVVTPSVLTASGQRFTVTPTGLCTQGSAIAVVDDNGASVIVTASNVPGALTTTTPDLVVAPTSVTLESCDTIASVSVAGGFPPYFVATSNQGIRATVAPRVTGGGGATVSIQRRAGTGAVTTTPQTLSISDGRTAVSVEVDLALGAQGPC